MGERNGRRDVGKKDGSRGKQRFKRIRGDKWKRGRKERWKKQIKVKARKI